MDNLKDLGFYKRYETYNKAKLNSEKKVSQYTRTP